MLFRSRQAVHRAHGTVELAQGTEGGAEFTVRLPLGALVAPRDSVEATS